MTRGILSTIQDYDFFATIVHLDTDAKFTNRDAFLHIMLQPI